MSYSVFKRICRDNKIGVVCIFRSHSSRIVNKINRDFVEGKSLLDIKLRQLFDVFPTDNIILAGDTIIDEVDCWQISRSIDLLIDNRPPFSEVLAEIFQKIEKISKRFDHLFITYPTCPTFTQQQYKKLIVDYYNNVIKNSKEFDSIMSVIEHKGFFWDKTINPINYAPTATGHSYTQDIDVVYEADNAIWGGNFQKLLKNKYLINDKPFLFINDKMHAVDIDTMEDFELAKIIYEKVIKNEQY